jgi:hypothetical protein
MLALRTQGGDLLGLLRVLPQQVVDGATLRPPTPLLARRRQVRWSAYPVGQVQGHGAAATRRMQKDHYLDHFVIFSPPRTHVLMA